MHFKEEDKGFLCSFEETFASAFAPCRGEVLADSVCSPLPFCPFFPLPRFLFARVSFHLDSISTDKKSKIFFFLPQVNFYLDYIWQH